MFGPCLRSKEEIFQVRSRHPFQPSPLLDGKKHCGFHPAFGHDLRSFRNGGIEEFTEPRLGVLNRPFLAHG